MCIRHNRCSESFRALPGTVRWSGRRLAVIRRGNLSRRADLVRAAHVVDSQLADVQLLPRHGPVHRGELREITPPAAVEVPLTITGDRGLEALLVLHRFERITAGGCRRTHWNARYAGVAARHSARARKCRQAAGRTRLVDQCDGGRDIAGTVATQQAFGPKHVELGDRHRRPRPNAIRRREDAEEARVIVPRVAMHRRRSIVSRQTVPEVLPSRRWIELRRWRVRVLRRARVTRREAKIRRADQEWSTTTRLTVGVLRRNPCLIT